VVSFSEVKEVVEILGMIYELCSSALEVEKAAKENPDRLPPNPFFLQNGFEGASPLTKKNLMMRKIKGFSSTAFSVLGDIAQSAGSVVNVADIAKHGTAVASSSVHLYRLRAMAEKIKDGGSLRSHLDAICQIKGVKIASRTTQGVVACIPVPGVSLIGTVAGLAHEKGYIGYYKKAVILSTATRLHWQAYRELKLLRGSVTQSGPALRIIRELIGVGITGTFDFGDLHSPGKMNEIINEPAGYMVVKAKLEQA
jgi:hypothetical protein